MFSLFDDIETVLTLKSIHRYINANFSSNIILQLLRFTIRCTYDNLRKVLRTHHQDRQMFPSTTTSITIPQRGKLVEWFSLSHAYSDSFKESRKSAIIERVCTCTSKPSLQNYLNIHLLLEEYR